MCVSSVHLNGHFLTVYYVSHLSGLLRYGWFRLVSVGLGGGSLIRLDLFWVRCAGVSHRYRGHKIVSVRPSGSGC